MRRGLYYNRGCESCVPQPDLFKDLLHEAAVPGELVQAFDEILDFAFFPSHLVFLLSLDMHRLAVANDVEDDFSKLPGDRHLGLLWRDAAAQPTGCLPQVGCGVLGGHGRHFKGVGQGVAGALGLAALAMPGAFPVYGGEAEPGYEMAGVGPGGQVGADR